MANKALQLCIIYGHVQLFFFYRENVTQSAFMLHKDVCLTVCPSVHHLSVRLWRSGMFFFLTGYRNRPTSK